MRNLMVIIVLLTLSCSGATKRVEKQAFDTYEGYFVKQGIVPDDELLYFASSDLGDFDGYFGMAATMSKQKWIEKADLPNKLIVAIANKADSTTQSLVIESINRQGDILQVNYQINKLDTPASFVSRYCKVALVPAHGVKQVTFYEGGKEVKQIAINK